MMDGEAMPAMTTVSPARFHGNVAPARDGRIGELDSFPIAASRALAVFGVIPHRARLRRTYLFLVVELGRLDKIVSCGEPSLGNERGDGLHSDLRRVSREVPGTPARTGGIALACRLWSPPSQ